MGVKFAREYRDIISDLIEGIKNVDVFYDFFEMTQNEWNELTEEEQTDCVRTLADDVFYGLGTNTNLDLGKGRVFYDPNHHKIKVFNGENVVHVINLV